MLPRLLILVPAHNEEDRIGPVLHRYAEFFSKHYTGRFRIVVVLNGCTDNTLAVVEQVSALHPEIQPLVFDQAIGKGGALIEGLRLAESADLIGFTDADGATSPESFLTLVERCREADCVIGSRRITGAVIRESQPSHRMLASKVFHVVVGLFFHMGIIDTQCGAKVMKREAVMRIHQALHIADMAFDINLLYSLKRAGYRIVEAPVEWTDHTGSKVRYFRTSLVMFLSVVRLRLIYSPFYRLLRFLRPLETLVYTALRNPPPLPSSRPGQHRIERQEGDVANASSSPG
jgi:glycosyltransferase involved in cell wall biosynthesis